MLISVIIIEPKSQSADTLILLKAEQPDAEEELKEELKEELRPVQTLHRRVLIRLRCSSVGQLTAEALPEGVQQVGDGFVHADVPPQLGAQ